MKIKSLILLNFLILTQQLFSQRTNDTIVRIDSNILKNQNEFLSVTSPLRNDEKYIYFDYRTVHFYNGYEYYNRNQIVKMNKKEKFEYFLLDDSNNIIIMFEFKPEILESGGGLGLSGDSLRTYKNYSFYGDSIYIPTLYYIYTYYEKKHGLYFEYYKDKSIKVAGKYKNRYKIGKWYYYNEKKKLIKVEKYKSDKLIKVKSFVD